MAHFDGQQVTLNNIFTNKPTTIPARSVLLVGLRLPNDGHALGANTLLFRQNFDFTTSVTLLAEAYTFQGR